MAAKWSQAGDCKVQRVETYGKYKNSVIDIGTLYGAGFNNGSPCLIRPTQEDQSNSRSGGSNFPAFFFDLLEDGRPFFFLHMPVQ